MKYRVARLVFFGFFLVLLSLIAMIVYSTGSDEQNRIAEGGLERSQVVASAQQGSDNQSIFGQIWGYPREKPGPCDRIKESQIHVSDERIVIEFRDAEWARFSDTNSMDPVIDSDSNAIEYVPKSPEELCVGDIVSYKSNFSEGAIIHRIVEIDEDEQGWYAVFKGDNIPYNDPERVRFSQIKRVVIGILY